MVQANVESAARTGAVLAGRYRVERVIARGGEGIVLLATHLRLSEPVAVKLCRRTWHLEAELIERTLREARAAFRIRSEHVARIIDVDVLDNTLPFIVMEYLEGIDLKRLIARRGALPIEEAVSLILQASHALAEAHALGIVHRDLKPSNLFLTHRADKTPLLKVLDFGLSKVTGASSDADTLDDLTNPDRIMGSARYMSPEQITNTRAVDSRADIWAIGVILHELLTATPLFGAKSRIESLTRVLTTEPPPISSLRPDVPIPIERAILRCLEKSPERRVSTIEELATALSPFAASWAFADRRESSVSASSMVTRATDSGFRAALGFSLRKTDRRWGLAIAAGACAVAVGATRVACRAPNPEVSSARHPALSSPPVADLSNSETTPAVSELVLPRGSLADAVQEKGDPASAHNTAAPVRPFGAGRARRREPKRDTQPSVYPAVLPPQAPDDPLEGRK